MGLVSLWAEHQKIVLIEPINRIYHYHSYFSVEGVAQGRPGISLETPHLLSFPNHMHLSTTLAVPSNLAQSQVKQGFQKDRW